MYRSLCGNPVCTGTLRGNAIAEPVYSRPAPSKQKCCTTRPDGVIEMDWGTCRSLYHTVNQSLSMGIPAPVPLRSQRNTACSHAAQPFYAMPFLFGSHQRRSGLRMGYANTQELPV